MIDKVEIAQQLQNLLEERLFGSKPWPIDNNDAVHQQLLAWGLIKITPAYGQDCICTTELGLELSVDLWVLFVGHHEPEEIPHILSDNGLITKEEADHVFFDRWIDGGEKPEDILPPILRRLYREKGSTLWPHLSRHRGKPGQASMPPLDSPFDDHFNAEKKFQCTECAAPLSPSFVQWPRDPNRAAHPSPTLCNKCCPRFSIGVVFLTQSGVAGAIDALRAVGYDVLVGDHIADPESAETVYLQVYGGCNRGDADIEARPFVAGASLTPASLIPARDAFWRDVEWIVEPFDGGADGCGLIDDDDVPFSNFRRR